MSKEIQRYRHIGSYGVCLRDGSMLVIHKGSGPYINRYDLPGGRVENHEDIFSALYREFREETGCHAVNVKQLGAWDCLLTWEEQGYDPMLMHHVALLFDVSVEMEPNPQHSSNQDSLGAVWVPVSELTDANSSPLVMAARHYAKTGSLPMQTRIYETWDVLAHNE